MNNTVRLLGGSLVFAVAVAAQARGAVPIIDHDGIAATTASGAPASPEQIHRALAAAGARRGWQFKPAGPGHAVGLLDVRGKHSASVDVAYKTGEYSIKYRDSSNLKYDAAAHTIHPKYNEWVSLLMDDTRAELAK